MLTDVAAWMVAAWAPTCKAVMFALGWKATAAIEKFLIFKYDSRFELNLVFRDLC